MKKILVSLILIIGLVFGGGYFLAFTQSGNNILLPFINSYLKQKVDMADVKLDSFTLKPNHLTAKANVNKMADISVDGDFDALKKKFDMIYTVNAKKIETKDFKFDEKIYIKGKAVGDIKKALIFGVGKVANSDIEYKLDLIDEKPQNITAKIDHASLKKLLVLAGQKPYADGTVTLSANIPSLDEKNLNGTCNLSLQKGSVSSQLIKKDFQVELPKNFRFDINSKAKLKGDSVTADTKLLTSLANLTLNQTNYNIKSNNLKAPYTLSVKNLANLYSLTKMKLKGDFKANGIVSLKNKVLSASVNTNSLGGTAKAYLVGDKLKATLKNITTNAIFYKLNLPKYTDAKINADINLKSISKLNGNFKITANGINKKSVLKKMYNFDSDRDIKYNLTSTGTIKNNKVYASTDIKNSFGDVKLTDTVFDIKTAGLKTLYSVYVDNLSKLNYITKQKLVGDLKAAGTITKNKVLTIDGKIKKFDGVITYKLVDDKLTAKVENATLSKIQKTISYPVMLEAKTFADLNYNLSTSKGKAVINMKSAKMMPNQLTKIFKALGGADLSSQHYNDTKLIANLSKNLIVFDFEAKSKDVVLDIKKGKIHQPAGTLDALLNVKIKKDKISLKITGTTSNPKIRLSGSSIENSLKQKAKEKVKEKLENELKKKLKIDKKDLTKDLFKKLF